MEKAAGDNPNNNWSEEVEDLVAAGDVAAAISLLASVVSKFEARIDSDVKTQTDFLQLSSALGELAKLYNSQELSSKADELFSRASLARERASDFKYSAGDCKVIKNLENHPDVVQPRKSVDDRVADDGHRGKSVQGLNEAFPSDTASEDDWEALADREPGELMSSQCLAGVSNLSIEDTKVQIKQRGRGTFSYKKNELYSDLLSDASTNDDTGSGDTIRSVEEKAHIPLSNYGTRHVLVFSGMSLATKTADLENLLKDFNDHGFTIRWVNDTSALAVFQAASMAFEAFNSIRCPFKVRILEENDDILRSIPTKALEPPPRQRPKTSARTAQRLIAQSLGIKLPSNFGSRELREQEQERRNRIAARHKLRDDAWGDEDTN